MNIIPRTFLLVLLLAPTLSSALDLKVGLMYVDEPLYNGIYSNEYKNKAYDDEPIVGRIELSQKFKIENNASLNVFFMHMSQLTRSDPHHGINAIGAELEFDLFN